MALSVPVVPGVITAPERTLPMLPVFAELFTTVQRGTVAACSGVAAGSLALALAAGPAQEGSWVAVAGWPALGLAAAAELGVPLDRLVAVPYPRQVTDEVLAAMIDGFDVVVLGPDIRLRSASVRRVQARAQARGVLLVVVDTGRGADRSLSADLQLTAESTWSGLGEGYGVAQARRLDVQLSGRRVPRRRRSTLWLPDAHGVLRHDQPVPVPVSPDGARPGITAVA
jgi:hypothetical protein